MKDTDNGLQAHQILNSLNLFFIIKKLNQKDSRIIKMLMAGYNQKEIIKKLKTNYPYIKRLLQRLKKLL